MAPRDLPDLLGVRVLLVEDHEDSRELFAYNVQLCGATSVGAGSAKAALAQAENERFDVVVADLGMPDEDGFWLLSELRRRGMQMPVIAFSGYVRERDEARCLAAGFAAFLTKPTDVDHLCHRIASLLGRE